MELWIRSTAKTNLIQPRFLTIMEGKTFYKENQWEYEGYTICSVSPSDNYELLGTYKTKERAIEVLDEIEERIMLINTINIAKDTDSLIACKNVLTKEKIKGLSYPYQMPEK